MTNRRKRTKKVRKEYFFDYSLLFIVLFLLGFGLVMLYSVSSYEAYKDFGDTTYYLKKQTVSIVIGLVGMVAAIYIPKVFFVKIANFSYAISIFLIFLIIPFGIERNGAKRWLNIPIINYSLQPAEVVKICAIIFFSNLIWKMGKSIKELRATMMIICIACITFLLLWKITDDLSSSVIVLGIVSLMVFVATPTYMRFIIVGSGIGVIGAVYLYYVINIMEHNTAGFRIERILAWLNPEAYAQGKGFQTLQALYAIGSGGIWGKGLGQSMQKLNGFIPEAQNDMIFSIICEEIGMFGGICIMLMFIMLLWRMMIIANNSNDLFDGLIVVGIIAHIALQVVLNIAVVTNLIPNTGVSLPFISYGGTSVMFLLIEVGMVLNVARRIQLKDI